MSARDPLDPRGVIREAYRIENIEPPSCRAIYLDWALGLPDDVDPVAATAALLERHEPGHPVHPMTDVLREGTATAARPPRRRGRRG